MKFPSRYHRLPVILAFWAGVAGAAPPVAVGDSFSTNEDSPLTVGVLSNLLLNDDAAGNAQVSVGLATAPAHGNLELNADGTFTYTPAANYFGSDSFSYKAYGDRQAMTFTIDEAASSVRLTATFRITYEGLPSVARDSDVSKVAGTVAVKLAPAASPFAVAQVTDLQATLTDAISLELGVGCIPFLGCLAGIEFETAANDVDLDLVTAGAPGTVAANGNFEQDGNLMGISGNVTLTGTGSLATTLPATTLPLELPAVPVPFNGKITSSGGKLRLDLPLNYKGTVSLNASTSLAISITGTIRATTTATPPPVEESAAALVNLTVNAVNDAPVGRADSYLVRSGTELSVPASGSITTEEIVAANAVWKYNHTGTDLGTAWRAWKYADSTWPSGPAELGYGDASLLGGGRPEATNIRPSGSPVRPTAYFRREFHVTNANDTRTLTMELMRDDGAAVYLNGVEIARHNLAPDAVYSTLALTAVTGNSEATFYPETVAPALLFEGSNVLAVEVHQHSLSDSFLQPADISFALKLRREKGLSGILVNDTDVDSPTFTAALHTQAAHGTATVAADGSFSYRPAAGFSGEDFFVYQLSDGGTEDAFVTLVPPGAVWRYLDDGTDQGTAWRAPNFNDSGWDTGRAELGYGDNNTIDDRPETTQINGTRSDFSPIITTYFRKSFTLETPLSLIKSLRLRLLRDDGAAVYLNGVEIVRDNLPANAAFDTGAPLPIEGAAEARFLQWDVPKTALVDGRNVLAVELHQNDFISNDASFDLELIAIATPGGKVSLSVASDDLDGDLVSDAWERANNYDYTLAADAAHDVDGDGRNTRAEFLAGTDSRNAASVLKLLDSRLHDGRVLLKATAVPTRQYRLQGSPDLNTWTDLSPSTPPNGGAVEILGPAPGHNGHRFFRIRADFQWP